MRRLAALALAAVARQACAGSGAGRSARCPPEGSGAESAAGRGERVTVFFENRSGETAYVYWLDRRGGERPLQQLENDDQVAINTFSGHAMRLRSAASGRLLIEAAFGTARRQRFLVLRCGGGRRGASRSTTRSTSLEDAPGPGLEEDGAWLSAHGARDGPALAPCPLAALLSEAPVRGLHVLCAVPGPPLRLCAFAHGRARPRCTHAVRVGGVGTVAQLAAAAMRLLRPGWRPRPQAPRPALFTASGRRLPGALTLRAAGVPSYRRALVFVEGGLWHWPPVRVGFERPVRVDHTPGGVVTLRTLSLRPRVFEVRDFLREAECTRMLERANASVDAGSREPERRLLPSLGDRVLEAFDERVQSLTRIPVVNAEPVQVMGYGAGARYAAHTDYFDPDDHRGDEVTLELTETGERNRVLTVLMYVSDVEAGGETVFPRHGGAAAPSDALDCSRGLVVRPERRKALLVYNAFPSGALDPLSLHVGCEVRSGGKWSANLWLWSARMDFRRGRAMQLAARRLEEWARHRDRREEADLLAFAARAAAAPPAPADPAAARDEL